MENSLIIAWIISSLALLKSIVSFINAKLDKKKKTRGFFLLFATAVTIILTVVIYFEGFIGTLGNGLKTGVDILKTGTENAYQEIKNGSYSNTIKDNLDFFSTVEETNTVDPNVLSQNNSIYSINPEFSKSLEEVPPFSDKPFAVINDNMPYFTDEEKKSTESFENYSEKDDLNRCGVAYANLSKELMPTEERQYIGMIKPSGWQISKYDFIDGKYLYNRCHLIAFSLAGENANDKNLITGTRYLNTEGMLPFEEMTAKYIRKTNNHVLYRVTPVFEGDNSIASGVFMEGYSVEDEGEGICFAVYCYNSYPGIEIDYKTGANHLK